MHTTPVSHRHYSVFTGIALAALLVAPLQGDKKLNVAQGRTVLRYGFK